MTKKELVSAMAEKTEETKVKTTEMLDALIEVISETLSNGEEVAISGLGKFIVRERAARTARNGRNPQTGETITIAASKVPAFKASKTLKDAVKAE